MPIAAGGRPASAGVHPGWSRALSHISLKNIQGRKSILSNRNQRGRHNSMLRNKHFIAMLIAVLGGVVTVCITGAQAGSAKHAFTPDSVPWAPAPGFLRPGAQLAVVEGDPSASTGDF